jgi:amino acid transporter
MRPKFATPRGRMQDAAVCEEGEGPFGHRICLSIGVQSPYSARYRRISRNAKVSGAGKGLARLYLKSANLPDARPMARQVANIGLWPLVAATFFMVSGGAYGTEDIIRGAGYSRGILILILTPILWSVPTAFMVGELASALPQEGGYYAWVRRGLGNFWGFQEAWLSLVASIFDMAIYPTLFVAYLTRLVPWFAIGHRSLVVGVAVIVASIAANIAGVRVVGVSSVWFFVLLSAPFAWIVILAPTKIGAFSHMVVAPSASTVGLVGGVLIAMWNYMGWDSASTIAAEVRDPQRTYPRAMLIGVVVVALTYIVPVFAMWLTGVPTSAFETGSWADLAELVGGPGLRIALVLGGLISALGMLNALVMSYSRLPLAMTQDGMLPPIFGKLHRTTGAPWVAILVCGAGWALCLGLGFERLITLDVLLTGASLVLEFVALLVLRLKEPELDRPFRVPGGLPAVALLGLCPTLLLGFSVFHSETERIMGMNGLAFGVLLIAAGFVVFWAANGVGGGSRFPTAAAPSDTPES